MTKPIIRFDINAILLETIWITTQYVRLIIKKKKVTKVLLYVILLLVKILWLKKIVDIINITLLEKNLLYP